MIIIELVWCDLVLFCIILADWVWKLYAVRTLSHPMCLLMLAISGLRPDSLRGRYRAKSSGPELHFLWEKCIKQGQIGHWPWHYYVCSSAHKTWITNCIFIFNIFTIHIKLKSLHIAQSMFAKPVVSLLKGTKNVYSDALTAPTLAVRHRVWHHKINHLSAVV